MATIGWIGLGHMGGPMTANLIKAGHEVRGFDLDEGAMASAAENGVVTTAGITEAIDGADVVFTMLPKGDHARAVYLGEGGILESVATDVLLVDSSTIDIESAQALHEAAAAHGNRFVDAPVSGGISGAEAGTLTFMVGGSNDAVQDAGIYLDPMAGNVIPTGGPTTGQAAKICNNLMLFINLASTSEGAVLADRLGLDRKVFWDIASVSSGDSWALRTWYPLPGVVPTAASNHDFAPTFTTELAHKDINLALSAARQTNIPLVLAEQVSAMFATLMQDGKQGLDCSAIVQLVDGTHQGSAGDNRTSTIGGAA